MSSSDAGVSRPERKGGDVSGTLFVAVVGVIVGGAGLLWQAYTHWSSGPRVKVVLAAEVGSPTGQFPAGMHLCLTVRNVGRMSAQITGYGFLIGEWDATQQHPVPSLPYTLPAGHEVRWYQACAGLTSVGGPSDSTPVTAYIDLGNGKRYESEQAMVPNVAIDRERLPGDARGALVLRGRPVPVSSGQKLTFSMPRTHWTQRAQAGNVPHGGSHE